MKPRPIGTNPEAKQNSKPKQAAKLLNLIVVAENSS
jgi:hypothetical protein